MKRLALLAGLFLAPLCAWGAYNQIPPGVLTSDILGTNVLTALENTLDAASGLVSYSSLAADWNAVATFKMLGTNSTARSLLAWMQDRPISPKDFGAVCDGSTNDATALGYWETALGTYPRGYVPGVCATQSPITFPAGGALSIAGDGPNVSKLLYTGATATGDLFTFGPSSSPAGSLHLLHLGFDTSTNMTSGYLVHIRNLNPVGTNANSIEDVNFGSTTDHAYSAVYFDAPNTTNVDHIYAQGTYDAMDLSGTVGGAFNLTNSLLINSGHLGLHIGGGVGGLYTEALSLGGNGQDMLIDEAMTSTTNKQLFFGAMTTFDLVTSSNPAVELSTSGSAIQDLVNFENAWFSAGGSSNGCGLQIDSAYQGYVYSGGGTIYTNTTNGVCNNSTSATEYFSGNFFQYSLTHAINNAVTNHNVISTGDNIDQHITTPYVGMYGAGYAKGSSGNTGNLIAGILSLNYSVPDLQWFGTGNGTDANNWSILEGSQLCVRALNDAFSSANNVLCFSRTGYVPTFATLNEPLAIAAGVPTLSPCGGGSPAATAGSSDNGGQITLGTGSPTSCTMTFATAFANDAFCVFTPASNYTGTYYVSAQSKTSATLTLGTGTSSAVFNYACNGN